MPREMKRIKRIQLYLFLCAYWPFETVFSKGHVVKWLKELGYCGEVNGFEAGK